MKQSNPLVDLSKAYLQAIDDPVFENASVIIKVLRLDEIHPIISGNKWFKLKYVFEKVFLEGFEGIITQGGAYSNHLMATAYSCKEAGLKCIGLVRGEAPKIYSQTLSDLSQYGMELVFVKREDYKDKHTLFSKWAKKHQELLWVEEGGLGLLGVKGAEEILSLTVPNHFTHIVCAVGTGTMLAGLVNSSNPNQKIIGIPVMKIPDTSDNEFLQFLNTHCRQSNYQILYDYHEGGYAKTTPGLLNFMNQLFATTQLPTDIVYTGKLLKATYHLASDGFFKNESRVLIIHSGGLQGNRSLPAGSLIF